jgi:hypothetical protein
VRYLWLACLLSFTVLFIGWDDMSAELTPTMELRFIKREFLEPVHSHQDTYKKIYKNILQQKFISDVLYDWRDVVVKEDDND